MTHMMCHKTQIGGSYMCKCVTEMFVLSEKNTSSPPPAYLVYAGLEPLSVTNMFPAWEVDESVTEINLAVSCLHYHLTECADNI